MLRIRSIANEKLRHCVGVFGLVIALVGVEEAHGQTVSNNTLESKPSASPPASTIVAQAAPVPVFTAYRNLTIGIPANEVREKLGKAKIDDKDGFFYEISDDEFAQIRLDGEGKVYLVAVTYTSKNKSAPSYGQVLGGDEPAANPNGSVYNLVRYPDAGYWIAYSRSGGDDPTITVTMQRL